MINKWFDEVTQYNKYDKDDFEAFQLGCYEELGEVAKPLARVHRHDVKWADTQKVRECIIAEVGDFLWYGSHEIKRGGHELKDYLPAITNCRPLVYLRDMLKGSLNHDSRVMFASARGLLGLYGITLEECLEYNRNKLYTRNANNKIQGDGDFR
jgi:hypothetical protein